MLTGGVLHGHAAGDLQSVRMIRDGREGPAAVDGRECDLIQRRRAVAPFRVHLQIAVVVRWRRPREGIVREDAQDGGPAEKRASEGAASANLIRLSAPRDGILDGG